ncbi:MAG TPA: cob(I)yrinic acid a,c-diamide adenosyltransferase [Acidobacteriota bacterium]|nr:cob(I)yrinic acid a,c-diamide adenosyltransferase [Acidobacteriota bacterium]HRV06956.1 cob(I)yrinic acid a,c-diamide adenosyltransferase [Acidobacteriota bacterium]
MGRRLSNITTRTGDDGETGLGDGRRVSKTHPRIEACGTVDELNTWLGMLAACPIPEEVRRCIAAVQHDLFNLGAELSVPGLELLDPRRLDELEEQMESWLRTLPPLEEFILPGGTPPAAVCHVARAVCRRAERSYTRLKASEPVSELGLRYLNRLSDFLFVLARRLNREAGVEEVCWRKPFPPES